MEDKDLDFLYQCSNDNLKLLADFMLYDKDGKLRWTEEISSTQAFKLYYPHEMIKLVPTLIDELQKFGGNSIFNLFRGHGVSYREMLTAVCKQLKVSYHKDASTELIEHYMLQKFLVMSVEKMTEEDVHHLSEKLSKETLVKQIGLLKAGSPLFIRLTTMLIAQLATKYGLKQAAGLVAKFMGGRAFAILAGPIGWVLSLGWVAFDIAGPAYRVIIPCTITIAYLRMVYDKSEDELNDILR